MQGLDQLTSISTGLERTGTKPVSLLTKIILGFVNWFFGALLFGTALIAHQMDTKPDWQSAVNALVIGALAGFAVSFMEQYCIRLEYIDQLGSFALPSIIGVGTIVESSINKEITIGMVFLTVWLCTLLWAMYHGDLVARHLNLDPFHMRQNSCDRSDHSFEQRFSAEPIIQGQQHADYCHESAANEWDAETGRASTLEYP